MLKAFFNPRGVAVVGASTKPGKVGHDIVANLKNYGYNGGVYPINPKAKEILGLPVFKNIDQLPDEVDLAVVAVAPAMVVTSIYELAQKNIMACVVVSSGFKEVGGEGTQLEKDLAKACQETGVRIIGPNCVGIMDSFQGLNASFAAGMPNKGHIGFFSQSGAMCLAILDWSLDNAIGFSKFISLGNKVDLTETEILHLLAEDEDTRVIMGYLEAVEDGKKFMKAAAEVTRKKPVVLLKSGVTSAGAKAASSHTGALAGADAAYEAAFSQCGVLRVHTVRQLFNLAQALARQPLLAGPAMAIVTNSGGPGIIAADSVEKLGMHMAGLRPETVDELRSFLPSIASVYNPVDITGGAAAELYGRSLSITAEDPNVDGLMVILSPTATVDPREVARLICEEKTNKPIFSVLMGRHSVEESRIYCMEQGMPAYDFPEDAVQAMAGMMQYRKWLNTKPKPPDLVEGKKEVVQGIINEMRAVKRREMSETEARECFKAYGINVAQSIPAATSDEAAAAAEKLGCPVVMKIDSPAISHKSDVGGVKVGLKTPDEVARAFLEMTSRVSRLKPNAWVRGVLVQEMVQGGRETIAGVTKDPQFGHLIMFGLGGIYVEVMKDVSFKVAPITREDADQMVKSINAFPLLRGVRGEPPADMAALSDAILSLASLVTDFPEVSEADINPLLVLPRGQGAMAVDARLSLSRPNGEE
ncbi:acetate--CoA ligase alpha subunit [Dethiosulfatarculus sandiegensis]|uniref:Acyl-CoA synthetase n=1 Tax=Dethiosulfatarculus sandiegensis TaxID=1429043 RepID=A0A0D2JAQ8_9BACT|nr:acetate--CoA ligase [Dethiosulfatarculus sandiegensis]KIX12816.1 acyl-CoA synthetase [Dethiosulfatarculus sandiegensis]